jgi:hypothetical protein
MEERRVTEIMMKLIMIEVCSSCFFSWGGMKWSLKRCESLRSEIIKT